MRAALPVLLLALALPACERTRFTAAPQAPGCDPRLVGSWSARPEEGGELTARVDEACLLSLAERSPRNSRAYPPTRLSTAARDGLAVLWVDAGWADAAFEVEATVLDAGTGIYLFAYRVEDDRLQVIPPDHAAIAHAIVDERIDGSTLKLDHDLVNRIDGDADAVAAILPTLPWASRKALDFVRTAEGQAR